MPVDDIRAIEAEVQLLREGSSSTELLKALEKLFRLEYRSDPILAETHAREIINTASDSDLKADEALGYRLLGVSFWARGEYVEALSAYTESTRIYISIGDELGVASVANNTGGIYLEQGLLDMALERILYALRLKEKHGDISSTACPYLNIGNIYRRLANYRQALVCYRQALSVWQKAEDEANIAGCYTNMGLVHAKVNALGRAMKYHQKALSIREEMGDLRGQAIALGNIAGVQQMQGESKKALTSYRRSLEIQQRIGDSVDTARSMAYTGQLLTEMGRLEEAEQELTAALELSRELGTKDLEANCHDSLSSLYEIKGDLRSALNSSRERYRLIEEYMGERSRDRLSRLQALFQISHREDSDNPSI